MSTKKKELVDIDPTPAPIDYDAVRAGLEALYNAPTSAIAIDTETTGLNVHDGRDRARGISYSAKVSSVLEDGSYEKISGYVAYDHAVGQNAPEDVKEMLEAVLLQDGRELIYQGAQFDINSLLTIDINPRNQFFYDVPTMANLVDENLPNKSMDSLAKKYAPHVKKLTEDDWLNDQKERGWPDTTPERMWQYAVNDAEVTYATWETLISHPEWTALPEELWDWKRREILVLLEMRRRGLPLNFRLARLMKKRGEARMKEILNELGYDKLGPKALTDLLLVKLELPVLKRSAKTNNPSFDKEVMEEYDDMLERMDSDVGKLVLEYRGWQKAVSAGYAAYLQKVSPDGRVRTEYTTHVTRTGRLSSKNPNLQQIPRESDKPWNGYMKACFVAETGFNFWGIDYSQLELRLMASFAGVQSLKQVFIEDRDIFTEMAETLGYARNDIKTFVYANSYGAGDAKIARSLGITVAAARRIREDYYAAYPELRIFSRKVDNFAKRHKKIPLWSGRFRHMPFASDSYKAMNSFIQGGGADVVARAMVLVFEQLDSPDCRIVTQTHDELGFMIRKGHEDHYLPKIIETMSDVDTIIGERMSEGTGTSFTVEADPWPLYEGEYNAG